MAYVHLDGAAYLGELLAVEAVEECCLGLVVGLLGGFLGAGVVETHAQIHLLVAVGELDGFDLGLLAALVGFVAVGLHEIDAVLTALEGEGSEVVAHGYDACALAGHDFAVFLAGEELHFGCGCEVAGGIFLKQEVGEVIESGAFGLEVGEEAELGGTGVAVIPECRGVVLPLPLFAQLNGVKLVALLGCLLGIGLAYVGFLVGAYGHAALVTVGVDADYGPAVFKPCHGLEVDYASVWAFVLEVYEPVLFTVGGVDPCALVGAVHVGVALLHDVAHFIGAPGIFGAEHFLPAGGHASGG